MMHAGMNLRLSVLLTLGSVGMYLHAVKTADPDLLRCKNASASASSKIEAPVYALRGQDIVRVTERMGWLSTK
ncbi:hypothetical protein HYDPIDRAFT_105024 [Hydnomerulius pinastri MD-312]|nr:hypothetical protein HYDPIDRAFT_105024 [Hydnomerulius pinastri MD-312]